MQNSDGEVRNILFISYAHQDRDTCRNVAAMTRRTAKRLGYEIWWDQSLEAGVSWNAQLRQKLDQTGAAILLVSLDALESEFIWQHEVTPLLKLGIHVAPLLVRPCPWEEVEQLKELEFLRSPSRALMEWSPDEREAELAAVARTLHTWLRPLDIERTLDVDHIAEHRRPASELPKMELGRLHSVPNLPDKYQGRSELLDQFRAKLIESSSGVTGITTQQRVGFYGNGGVGKSVLAAALARDPEVRQAFPDGIYWVTVGERPNIPYLQEMLARQLDVDISAARTNFERRRVLAEQVRDRRCLIIADDVWSGDGATSFNLSGRNARVLFTTRIERILKDPEVQAAKLLVPELTLLQAKAFVREQIAEDIPLTAAAINVIKHTGGVIFALGIAVGAFLNGLSWEELDQRFAAAVRLYPDMLETNLRAMRVAMSTLCADERERYSDLVVFPTDQEIPISTIDRFWRHSDGSVDTLELLERFRNGKLLEIDGDLVRFHDDQILYLSGRTTGQTSRNAELLNAHRPESGHWRDLPHEDSYMWSHLALHLVRAADYDQQKLALDLQWIAQQWHLNGPSAVEGDLALIAEQQDVQHPSQVVLRRVRRFGHLMRELTDVSSIANTLNIHLDGVGTLRSSTSTKVRNEWADWIRSAFPLDTASDALERVLTGHAEGARAVTAFRAADEWQLASAGADENVKIWNIFATEEDPIVLTGHEGWLNTIHVFRWDGSWFCASGGDDRKVRLWDLTEIIPEPIVFGGNNERVTAISTFTEDEQTYLCVGSAGSLIRVWRLSDRTTTSIFHEHNGAVHSVIPFRQDGKWRIVSGGLDGTLRIWDPYIGKQLHSILCPTSVRCTTIVWPGGHLRFACGHTDGTVSIRTVDGAEEDVVNAHAGPVKTITAFEHAGAVSLVSASTDGSIKVYDVSSGLTLKRTYSGHSGAINSICVFLAKSTWHLCSASRDGSIRIWDISSPGNDDTNRHRHTLRVQAIVECRSRTGPAVLTASRDGSIRLWNRSDPQHSVMLVPAGTTGVGALTHWESDGRKFIAWAAADGLLRAAQLRADARITDPVVLSSSNVTDLCVFRSDADWMLAACSGRTIRVWKTSNLEAATPIELSEHSSIIHAICAVERPDRPMLLSACNDTYVRLWDLRRPDRPVHIFPHQDPVRAVTALCVGGTRWRAATGTNDGKVRLIDLDGRSQPRLLGRHPAPITAIAAVPTSNGMRIVSGTEDGFLLTWHPDASGTTLTSKIRLGRTVTVIRAARDSGEFVVAFDTNWAILSLDPPFAASRRAAGPIKN